MIFFKYISREITRYLSIVYETQRDLRLLKPLSVGFFRTIERVLCIGSLRTDFHFQLCDMFDRVLNKPLD